MSDATLATPPSAVPQMPVPQMAATPSAVTGPGGVVALPPFSLAQVLPWLLFAGLVLVTVMYFVSAEQGATSLFAGNAVHEWVHDGRHLLGFPCH